ncbi:hypothetical protein Tco_0432313 [Tanacetum coccineum]
MSIKKIYKPTNNNLITSSNTRNTNVDNTPKSNKGNGYNRQTGQYDNKRAVKVIGARENVGTQVVQQTGIQCFKFKVQEVIPEDAKNFGPIFNTKPLKKVHTANDHYDVFANERQHPEQPETINDTYVVEQDDRNISPDSSNMCSDKGDADQDYIDQERCYNDNLALMLAPEYDETIRLAQESRSKLRTESRTANILEHKTATRSNLYITPLSSNSFAARRNNPVHSRLSVFKAHDGKSQASC